MKKILSMFTLSLALLLGFAPGSRADGRVVPFEKLPAESKTFIRNHYGSVKVLQVLAEWDEFDVLFADRTQVEFDRRGNWKKVKAPKGGAIPENIVPSRILQYITLNFPGDNVRGIERNRWGYEVEISSGFELEFDKNCNFVRIDD